MTDKKTLVLGASPKTERFSNKAVRALRRNNHSVIAIGKRESIIEDVPVITEMPELTGIDTVTLYLGPDNQPVYYDYIIQLKPKRIIFNPGTENEDLYQLAMQNGIEAVESCTLVMLSSGTY